MKLNEPNVLKVRLHKVFLDKNIQPLKVMVTGDWHISPIVSEKQLGHLKESIVQADPDVIILQGDMVDSPIELRRETSLKKLIHELKLCAGVAPTVLVLGSHDFITPTRPAKVMTAASVHIWKKICKRCGVKLLLNEWCDIAPGLRIFGAFQDARCSIIKNRKGELVHKDMPGGFVKNLRDTEEKIAAKSDFDGVTWFAAHAPLLSQEVIERLRPFDIASFGHTHGGVVPRGLDEIFDKLHLHFGFVSADKTPLPRKVRGIMQISDDTIMVVNPGMVATQFCAPKVLQSMNFIKAAEVSVVELMPIDDETEVYEDMKETEDVKEIEEPTVPKKSKKHRGLPKIAFPKRKTKATRTIYSDLQEYF